MLKLTPFKFLVLKENETKFMVHGEPHTVVVHTACQGTGRLGTLGLFTVVLEVKCLLWFQIMTGICSVLQFKKSHVVLFKIAGVL